MIASLRESKARLSELVERAASGEEVLITVRGRPRARLVPAQANSKSNGLAGWSDNLRKLQKKHAGVPAHGSVVEELRAERW